MTKKEAHKECLSRDCSCVLGKDRDSNYHEIIDKIYDYFEKNNCGNCKYWTRFSDKHNLRKCLGDNGCNVTGDKFFCASWEKIK